MRRAGLLEREVASLQKQLDQQVQQTGTSPASRTRPAASSTRRTRRWSATGYAASMSQSVYVGSPNGGMPSAVGRTLINADGRQLRTPRDEGADRRAADRQDARRTPGGGKFTARAASRPRPRALGEELVLGGDTPLWNAFTDCWSRAGRRQQDPADGVIVVRTAAPQRDGTRRSSGAVQGLALGRRPGGRGRGKPTPPPRRSRSTGRRASRPWTTWTHPRAPRAGAPACRSLRRVSTA